jgi:hypothetical protein
MLTLSSHTSRPQPESRENPVHTINDAPHENDAHGE